MSLLGAVVRKIDPKTAINYFRRNLMGSGSLGRKEISKIKGDLKNLSQEDRERLRTADLEDLTPSEVDLVMFGFVGFKDFGMPNKTIAQMKGNEFSLFKDKLNKIVDDVRAGKTESVEEFTFEKGIDGMPDGIKSKMVEKQKELPKGEPTQTTLFNKGGNVSLLNDERDNYIFGGLAAKAGKVLPGSLRGFVKNLVKLSNAGDYANYHQNNTGYFSPLNDTTELLRRKKPKYESDGYFLLAESNRRQKENIATPAEIKKNFKKLEEFYLEKFPEDFHADVKEALEKAKQLDLDAIKEDKLSFKEDQKRIRKLINDLKGKEKNRTEMKDGGVSMLKPDYIDIDGDGNKTEPMKTAAKQRDGMAIGGIVRALSSKAKQILRRELPKLYDSVVSKQDAKFKVRSTTPDDIIKDYEKGEDIIFYTTDEGTDSAIPESVIEELLEKFDKRNTKAEGGDIDGQMAMLMIPKEPEENMMPEEDMLPDDEMEDEYLDFILDEALDSEEEDYLMSQLQGNEQLSEIFDKVIDVAQEFAGSGPVEGPGSGVSDSIPARLSDGEFVFTAKAVEEIGADNLMAMMKDAEMKADDRQGLAEGGEPEEEETVVMPVEKSAQQDIRVTKETVGTRAGQQEEDDLVGEEVKKSMLRGSRNLG